MIVNIANILGNQIKANINHSVTSSKAYYENESDNSLTFKGTTTIVRIYYGYRTDNGKMEMMERMVSIGANEDDVVKYARVGLTHIPFKICSTNVVREIRNGSGFDSSYNVAYGKEIGSSYEPTNFAFALACNDKFEITEEISDGVFERALTPYLSFTDYVGKHTPLFLCVEFYSIVDEYFHSGKVNYYSLGLACDEIKKGFLTLNCYSCNKQTFSLTKCNDFENVENELVKRTEEWESIRVEDAETDKVTMCASGFNGRY